MKTSLSNKPFLCAVAMAVGILGGIIAHAQPGGVALWTNRYDGPGSSNDQVSGIAVDRDGNVLVTGYSIGSGSGYDYATIKYSSAGVPLWTNRYNGPGNTDAYARAVAVDGSGNVLVTGEGGLGDYLTIKYSGAGVPLWTNRYRGPGNGFHRPSAVAVDSSGNVFVTGLTADSGIYFDFATIKYSAEGVPLWTNRYNGPGNDEDSARAMGVDGNGNVIVTGKSWGSSSGPDYATIKYSAAGAPLWTNRYNGPGNNDDQALAIAVDSTGNLIVAGYSYANGRDDYTTIKYLAEGVPLWTNRAKGLGPYSDQRCAVAVDGIGNVFMTASATNYTTIKYSTTGVPLWTNRYNGSNNGNNDYARAVAVDGNGNVIVTGYSLGSGSSNDFVTITYSTTGVPLWTNRYNGPGDADDKAYAVAVDDSGNVYVTGSSWNGASYDYATIKYSSTGPSLTIACTPTNTVAVSWPSPAADFTLKQSTNAASTNWTPVGTTPADDGTNKTVIIDPPEGNRFYRLFHP